ncbi:serine hydrolase domain-containing protein [Maribacter sp. TH_r10]|uniref:serine hydrolase domain-containing protein n=1 Tax=Maribacter sp. TH_r10 TaxID=3082086 RepID=UPI002955B41C|nr:serine hydrolase domain-containing protein [Maribacter sp. TH_r10]MDV7140615.1 serine hydrolase domain-containing protein [Maribacter sp. TH_r10]
MNSFLTYLKSIFTSESELHQQPSLKGKAKVDDLLNTLIAEKKLPGLAITVRKQGEEVFQKGYGFADIEANIKVDPKRTVFRIASVSKNIAATALAQMVKENGIDLDASLYDYVPYFPKKEYDFTIRQLANHTAGIRGYKGMEYGLNQPFSIKESLRIFKDDDLLFKPGTDYHYNSFDWVLISLAMQEASGVSFENYVREKVLLPMGLLNTFGEPIESDKIEIDEEVAGHMATFYSRRKSGFRKAMPVNNHYKLAGGGYLSTSEDIANFGQAYLKDGILKDKVISEFLTAEKIGGKSTYYGLGWQVSLDASGRSYFGHVGNGVGGYSNLFIYPKEEMVFSILTNCTNPRIQDVLDAAVNTFLVDSQ